MENVQKDFIPGDKWLYFKLYTGVKTADTLLLEIIQPLSEELLTKNLIDKWFFIRYSDPDFHLRVRFYLPDTSGLGIIISRLNSLLKPYLCDMLISNFQVDTYSRELDRYGENTIEEAESLFFYDSKLILQLLNLIEGDEGEVYRWHFACMAIDSLLSDFGYSKTDKLELLDRLQFGFGQEFKMNNDLKVQLDKKYRNERQNIRSFLLRKNDFYQPFYNILDEKSKNTTDIVKKILEMVQNNELEIKLDDLVASYIHMLLNRIFKSKQRLNEMVIYSLLFRFYKSELARKKAAKVSGSQGATMSKKQKLINY